MNLIPSKWKTAIKDHPYMLMLINPKFIQVEGLTIIEAHYNPKTFSENWSAAIEKHPNDLDRIENTLNHVHLSSITESVDLQEKVGQYIMDIWKKKLKAQFPKNQFGISLLKNKGEWELGLWTKRG